jgi:DNA-binding response OmpR family regulator
MLSDRDEQPRIVMIVDDHEATRRALSASFLRRGWRVRTAATVAEAMALLDSGLGPDELILDLGLPDGDGEAVMGRVRSAGLATRVSVLTGLVDPRRLARARELDPDLVLIKPLEAAMLGNLLADRPRPA